MWRRKRLCRNSLFRPARTRDAWERAVAIMDAEDQVVAVVAKLKKLNPKFDTATVKLKINGGAVVSFSGHKCDALWIFRRCVLCGGLKKWTSPATHPRHQSAAGNKAGKIYFQRLSHQEHQAPGRHAVGDTVPLGLA